MGLVFKDQRTQSNPFSNQNSKQLHETRENLGEQVTIGFGFTCDWLRRWRELLSQSLSVVIQTQIKGKLLSTLKQKPLYKNLLDFACLERFL